MGIHRKEIQHILCTFRSSIVEQQRVRRLSFQMSYLRVLPATSPCSGKATDSNVFMLFPIRQSKG